MASKVDRLQTIIMRNISEIIQIKLKDPRLGFVSIPYVKVSSDLSYAKVFVSFIKDEDIKPGLEVLEHSKGFIRSELAKKLDTRRCPEISFALDDTFVKAEHLDELFKKI